MSNNDYYAKSLCYQEYLGDLGTDINSGNFFKPEHIQKIYAKSLNNNFIWIFIFEKWIETANTCITFNVATNGKFTDTKHNGTFQNFNLNPYDKSKDRVFPLIDFSNIITFFNQGETNESFKNLVDKGQIKKFLDKIGKNGNQFYIDTEYARIKDSLGGTFFSILAAFDFIPDEYFMKEKFNNNGTRIDINYDLLKTNGFEKTLKDIKDWKTLKDPENTESYEIYMEEQRQRLESLGSKIFLIFQSLLDMYCSVYNEYYQQITKSPKDPPSIDMSAFNLSKQDETSLPLEEYILRSRPKIAPSFKKSYVVRENNLKPFLNIRLEYQVGSTSKDFVNVNYFDIPYNNIISMEHNVKDFSMTINLIDTEGNLSELLIQKMYAISQKKNNALVEKNINSMGEYRFFVEYGWSGPSSSYADELMEEQVYVKSINRGYIKSISSQYSFKGNEYTLTIIPNDLNSYNTGLNDTSTFYFKPIGEEKVVIPMGLLGLYFLLKNPISGLYDIIENMTTWESKHCDVTSSFLQKMFCFLDVVKLEARSGQVYISYKPKSGNDIQISKDNSFNEDEKIIMNILISDGKTIKDKRYKSIGTSDVELKGLTLNEIGLDMLKDKFDSASVNLNAWLAGAYIIWKLSIDGDLIVCDTTGLFNFITFDSTKRSFQLENGNLHEGYQNVIKQFNPYCTRNGPYGPNTVTGEKSFYEYILNGEKNSKFNLYGLSELFNLTPNDDNVPYDEEKARDLTFLVSQFNAIFSEIKKIGMDRDDVSGNPNVFHASNGIRMNYDLFKKNKDDIEDLFFEYKKKIYSDRSNIYVSTKPKNIEKDNRHETKFGEFKKHVKEVFKSKEDELNTKYNEKVNKHNKNVNKFNETHGSSNDRNTNSHRKKLNESRENLIDERKKLDKQIELNKNSDIRIIYLSYMTDPNMVAFLNCNLSKKISLLGKQLVQSYSFTPRISPKTRSANKQFFSQGNKQIMHEGTGDIIEFSIDPLDVGSFNSVMLANKNKNNVGGFNGLNSNSFAGGIYQNATNYYRTYRSIEGDENPYKIAEDMARLDRNYQTQTVLKGSITIPGEPYWSNVNLLMAKCIYIHVYYSNGMRSSHSGLYYVSGVVQSISDGKFTTKLEIVRAPTFLSSVEKKVNKNTNLG